MLATVAGRLPFGQNPQIVYRSLALGCLLCHPTLVKRRRLVLADWLARLQATGRYTFTLKEALGEGATGDRTALWRAQRAKHVVQPRKGFYVIVPAEYGATGSPPATWFVDPLMRAQGEPYYVGLLSAAALYGASAQAVQELQVVAAHPMRTITVGRVRLRFVMRGDIAKAAVVDSDTPTGHMRVSTPEQTVVDLVTYPHAAGGWDNVASVVVALAPQLDGTKLRRIAERQADVRAVQRLGYLLDLAGAQEPARALATWFRPRAHGFVPFETRGAVSGAPRNERWNLILNHILEIE